MNKLKISIVIPTFNREKFIDKTLSSIFSINDDNIEVIVVDNASTDNTLKKIKNYCSSSSDQLVDGLIVLNIKD